MVDWMIRYACQLAIGMYCLTECVCLSRGIGIVTKHSVLSSMPIEIISPWMGAIIERWLTNADNRSGLDAVLPGRQELLRGVAYFLPPITADFLGVSRWCVVLSLIMFVLLFSRDIYIWRLKCRQ
jgi:hypothetical protein